MARTITQIQDEIKATYVANMAAIGQVVDPATWSKTDLRGIWIYCVAFCFWTIEKLQDILRLEIDNKIAELKPHSTRWYAQIARKFQFGYDLAGETDTYDNTGLTEEQIADSKVIHYSAVNEQEISPGRWGIRIKVATTVGSDLGAVPGPAFAAFQEYMKRVKDAGVGLLITTGPADSLQVKLDVYYNPLVLNAQGQRLDGTDMEPVQNAIKTYLKNLPFNGVLTLAYLVDQLQQVDGVVIPHLLEAKARYGALPFTAFSVEYTPDAGYLRLVVSEDLTIQFIPKNVA